MIKFNDLVISCHQDNFSEVLYFKKWRFASHFFFLFIKIFFFHQLQNAVVKLLS